MPPLPRYDGINSTKCDPPTKGERMPVQQQMSSFAGRLGARVAAANAEYRGKPIDTGNRRLPGGIKEGAGVAKVQSAYTKQQTE